MKSLFKKVGKYLTILLLLLIGLAALALIFLFFVPSASIFGISYVNADKTYYSTQYSVKDEAISYVSVKSLSYPVRVVNSDNDNISVSLYNNIFGFVHKNNKTPKIKTELVTVGETKQLLIEIEEPHGVAYKNNSYISINLPKSATIDLNLSNKNAGVKLDLADTVINNFTYEANSGDIYLSKGAIKQTLNLKLGCSRFVVNKDFNLNNTSVLLNLTSGSFNTTNNDSIINDLSVLNLTTGTINVKSCKNLNGHLTEGGGKLSVGTLTGALNFTSSDTDVTINNQTGDGGTITLSKSGDLTINNLECGLVANTDGGNINIAKTTAAVHLKSNSGNITIQGAAIDNSKYTSSVWENEEDKKQVDSPIWLENKEGKINLTFAEGDNVYRTAYVNVKDGQVDIKEAEHVKVLSTGNAFASVTYKKVVGNSYLEATGSGSFAIYVPTNAGLKENQLNKYTLITQSKSGSVSIAITQTIYLGEQGDTSSELHSTYVGTQESNPQGEEWKNNIVTALVEQGSISVRDY